MLFAAVTQIMAAGKLDLKEITKGTFRETTIAAVNPLADGETYAQISTDGKQIVKYSFKTGKQVAVLFDVSTARGAKLDKVDGYVMSPKGDRILIQTQTKSIYRRSFTAVYYRHPFGVLTASRLLLCVITTSIWSSCSTIMQRVRSPRTVSSMR